MSLALLWLLARLEFPERPVSPNPVPAVLGQLTDGPFFSGLADSSPAQPDAVDVHEAGLTLVARAGAGSEVLDVVPGSLAARAGLEPGDVITTAGDAAAPDPIQVTWALAARAATGGVMLSVVRGEADVALLVEP
ncbi:MAG: PDZ domain-containing protein [Vicinamibacterales bacterium]